MAKSQPIDRFRISCECEVSHLGQIMVQLARIEGLRVTGNELITEINSYATKRAHEVAGATLLTAWISDHPSFKALEAVRHFEEDGRHKSSAYAALGQLVETGVLKKLDQAGHYARTDIKAIAPPKNTRKTFDRNAEDVILTYARRNHGRFNTARLVEMFLEEGRARNSLYASIDHLMKQKLVKRVGEAGSGQYALLAKASKKASKSKPKKPPKKKPVIKGNGSIIPEVTDHG
jgi:hypothetical protein